MDDTEEPGSDKCVQDHVLHTEYYSSISVSLLAVQYNKLYADGLLR